MSAKTELSAVAEQRGGRPVALSGRARWRGVSWGNQGPNGKGNQLSINGDVCGPVWKERRPRCSGRFEAEEGRDRGALTIEAHVMVGEDGWAVPLGGTPDHHMQKAIRRLNVMFLEGRESAGPWEAPMLGFSGE